MTNRIVYSVLVLLLVSTFQSCKKDNNDGPTCSTDGSANFPHLEVGHRMDYYITGLFIDDDTMTFDLKSSPSAGTYYVECTSRNGGAASFERNLYWHACGRDMYTSDNGNWNQFGHWWISLDANVGDTWTRTENGKTYYYELFSKNATVVTYDLGQTFTNCYKYTFNQAGTFNVDTIYFKPELGIVSYEGFLANYELISKNF
jgi:hypothetical protein